MRLKESLIIGLMVLLSLSLMQSEAGRARAMPPVMPSGAAPEATLTAAELEGLLALAQSSALPALPAQASPMQTPPRNASAAPVRAQPGTVAGIPADLVDDCMDVAEQINPEWAARLRSFCEHSPDEFARYIMQSGRRLVALAELKRREPRLYQSKLDELRTEALIADLVHKLRHLHGEGQFDSPEAMVLREDLRVQVTHQVAYSLKARGDYVLRLKDHIKALEDQLEQDALRFFYIVEERYQTLIDMP